MIQNIAPHVLDNRFYTKASIREDACILFMQESKFLFRTENDVLRLPAFRECGMPAEDLRYLISVDDCDYYLSLKDAPDGLDVYHYGSLPDIRYASPAWMRYGVMTAHHLACWYLNNRYCGHCGGRMEPVGYERALECAACKNRVYPRINPCVIVGIIKGDRMLLTRSKMRPKRVNHSLVAGFAEIGETIEETVHREVMEETRLKVRNLHYYKSQPWALSASLLFGFYCELDGEDTLKLDDLELAEAVWASQDEITERDEGVSLTSEMIEQFRLHGRKVLDM